jgi:hypothetical protein
MMNYWKDDTNMKMNNDLFFINDNLTEKLIHFSNFHQILFIIHPEKEMVI